MTAGQIDAKASAVARMLQMVNSTIAVEWEYTKGSQTYTRSYSVRFAYGYSSGRTASTTISAKTAGALWGKLDAMYEALAIARY